MPNRLADATSPYLLQHKDNPVDWWEWSEDAFNDARERNVPVLLSVGYAACHWCHVMAHESFEDEATAAYMNEHYVNIKVDREERPDVDAVYMQATVALTGQGGWPMTCVLDHEGSPFFAGTYFPDQPRHGQPSFRQLLEAIDDAWTNRSDEVAEASTRIREALARDRRAVGRIGVRPGGARRRRRASWAATSTRSSVGSGERRSSRRRWSWSSCSGPRRARPASQERRGDGHGRPDARRDGGRRHPRPARGRLRALRRRPGLGGAALREDALRQRPAALGLRALGAAATTTPTRPGSLAASPTSCSPSWAPRRVPSPPRWTRTPRARRAPSTSGRRTSSSRCSVPTTAPGRPTLLTVTERGTFEGGTSTLQLREQPDDRQRWESCRERLLEARATRVRPDRDDKVVAAWNGLAISGLVDAGTLLGDPVVRRGRGALWRVPGRPPPRERPAPACLTRWRRRHRMPECSRTTAALPPGSSRSPAPPATASGWIARARCSTRCSRTSRPTTAASTTPPTTPRP